MESLYNNVFYYYEINMDDLIEYLSIAIFAAHEAGNEILKIYNSNANFNLQPKADNSPLTIADKKSNELISKILQGKSGFLNHINNKKKLFSIPILSEEGKEIDYEIRKRWEYFWLVDPLDGTKEFINRNGEFTVNIALIKNNMPVLGVVYLPVTGIMYYAGKGIGAFKFAINLKNKEIHDNNTFKNELFFTALTNNDIEQIINKSTKLVNNIINDKTSITVIASRSHMSSETEEFINNLKKKYNDVTLVSAGSSLKLCYVAEGKADIYPRLGPTMEWDTAAAHAVVNGAGKKVMNYDRDRELTYNKQDLRNPWFVVK